MDAHIAPDRRLHKKTAHIAPDRRLGLGLGGKKEPF